MPESSNYQQRNLVLDKGHMLDQVLTRSGIPQKIAHKELGIMSRTKCCWNSQKADLRCRWTNNWDNFSQYHFCQSSVFTEHWRLFVKNLRTIKMDRGNLRFWSVNQLFSVKLRQKFLCRMKTLQIIKFNGNNTWNELNRFHQKAKWVNSVRKQDLCVLFEVGQYFVTKDTGDFRQLRSVDTHINVVTHLVNALFHKMIQLHNQKDGSKETLKFQGNTLKLGPCLKLQLVTCTVNMELRSEFVCENKFVMDLNNNQLEKTSNMSWNSNLVCGSRQFSIFGQNFHGMIKYVVDSNQNNTEIPAVVPEEQASQLKVKILQPDQRQKQNHKRGNLLTHQVSFIPMHERKWIDIEPSAPSFTAYDLSKKVISLLRHCQTVQREKDGAMKFYSKKFHFRHQSSQTQHWSDERWKSWQEEVRKEDTSIALIILEQ